METLDLDRRSFLGGAATGAILTGTVVIVGSAVDAFPGGNCPEPVQRAEIDVDVHQVAAPWREPSHHGLRLIPTQREARAFTEEFDEEAATQFVEDTDFETEWLLSVRIAGSRFDGDVRFTGLERVTDDVVHGYSCGENPQSNDAGESYGWLVRADDTPAPTTAYHTHVGDGAKSFETNTSDGA